MKTLIAANWKMYGEPDWAVKPRALEALLAGKTPNAECLICPPAYLIMAMTAAAQGTGVAIGAQTCHDQTSGAFTGEMSAEMAAAAGASYVIVGHSERRSLFGETDAIVHGKAEAVRRAGLTGIICVGESLEEREAGNAFDVVTAQIEGSVPGGADGDNTVIAYEPVWAIGTGKVPTIEDIAAMHDHIRGLLTDRFGGDVAAGMRILYGGSVKPANAKEILALSDVNGALIGGASLEMDSFAAIAKQA